MKLFFMKQNAIDFLKANMKTIYMNYYRYNSNEWLYDLFEYDPFELFCEMPEFSMAPIGNVIGETELENCKRLYSNLKRISESQAADERLWAGLCNSTFYSYVRGRWKYGSLQPKDPEKDSSVIISRFFFSGGGRAGMYRNTLSKCWWVGRSTYDPDNSDHWKMLDILGAEDFSTKVSDIFYSNTFAANAEVLHGICKGLQYFRIRNQKLLVRDHIRPTMKYLNALGGGILLDTLSEDDIAAIVVENINRLKNGEIGDFIEDANEESEVAGEMEENEEDANEINMDYQEEKEIIERENDDLGVSDIFKTTDNIEKGILTVGCIVNHISYGRGTVQGIIDKNAVIKFENGKEGLFGIEECMKKKFLTIE